MQFVAECLLGGFELYVAARACIRCKDGRSGETEQMVFLEVLGYCRVHLTEVAAMTLVEDDDHVLLEYLVSFVLLHEDGQFLNGGDDYLVFVRYILPILLFLVLQLVFQYLCGCVSIRCSFTKLIILLHRLVVEVFSIDHEQHLVDVVQA